MCWLTGRYFLLSRDLSRWIPHALWNLITRQNQCTFLMQVAKLPYEVDTNIDIQTLQTASAMFYSLPISAHPTNQQKQLSLETWGVLKKRLAFGNRRALCVLTETQGLTSFFLPPLQESLMNRALQSYSPATSCLYCCKQRQSVHHPTGCSLAPQC